MLVWHIYAIFMARRIIYLYYRPIGPHDHINRNTFHGAVDAKGLAIFLVTYRFYNFIQSFVSNAHRGDRGATLRHFTPAIETQTSSLSLRA